MAFPTVANHPGYSGTFIPEIWSGKAVQLYYDSSVLNQITNTEHEGEIKNAGDTVNIRTTPKITLRPYVKGQAIQVEQPEAPKIQLLIDQAEYFSCALDDVDKVQSDMMLMDMWTKDAAKEMVLAIDKKVLTGVLPDIAIENKGATAGRISGDIDLGVTGSPIEINSSNVLDKIIDMGTVLTEANVSPEGRFLVIPAKMGGYIKQSDLKDASITGDGSSPLRNGRLGMIDTFTVYVSHLLKSTTGSNKEFSVIAGHKDGITFAMQLTNMESLRSHTTFGTIIRALQVYGYKVVKPEALSTAIITL